MAKKTKKTTHRKDKRIGAPELKNSSYYDKYPLWAFRRIDFDHPKWGLACNLDKLLDVLAYLKGLETQTWGEILTDTSGRTKSTRNHPIGIDELCSEAQKRVYELKLEEFEELVSIAISGTERVWGVLLDGVFYIVWYDPQHEVYPTEKRYT